MNGDLYYETEFTAINIFDVVSADKFVIIFSSFISDNLFAPLGR